MTGSDKYAYMLLNILELNQHYLPVLHELRLFNKYFVFKSIL